MRDRGRTRRSRHSGALRRIAPALAFALLLPATSAAEEEEPEGTFAGFFEDLFSLREPDDPAPLPSRNTFGMTGLLDMPSADMQPDGEIAVTAAWFGGTLRNTIAVQIFPGVEAAFRYSAIGDFSTSPDFGGTLYDRSFDIKARLVKEERWWPSVAIGLQDFLGTGIYSGEYIVATKHFGPDIVVTGGIGWGRFAGRNGFYNPFRIISDRFATRDGFDGQGGTPNFGRYFQGSEASPFAGIEWHTPVKGLTVKAEYSPDTYRPERRNGPFDPANGFNFGLDWRPMEGMELGAYYMYGSEFGLRLTLTGNPNRPLFPGDLEPGARPFPERAPPPDAPAPFGEVVEVFTPQTATLSFPETGVTVLRVEDRGPTARFAIAELPPSADDRCPLASAVTIDAEYGVVDAVVFQWADGTPLCTVALRPAGEAQIFAESDPTALYPTDWHASEAERSLVIAKLAQELQADGMVLEAIDLQPRSVEIYLENNRYRAAPRALGRAARGLARAMPDSVETFVITLVEQGVPVVSIGLRRRNLELHIEDPDAARRSFLTADITEALPRAARGMEPLPDTFPRFSWGFAPEVPINAFDPDQPLRADLAIAAEAKVEFMPGLSLNARVQKRLFGQLDEITRASDSVLPRVRSDFAQYLDQGDPGIDRLSLDYLFKIDEDIYGRLSAGYLESMFGGVSAELLWKPVDQSWGLGAELNWTQQREFDKLFGFRDYQVATGHVSVYWDTGFYDLQAQVDAGRYLARDWGATFSLSRRWSNGWEIGAFFTLTDVPFDDFGEGSFDKGITLTIPLNWALPGESRSQIATTIRPLTRDGGQRLAIANRLYPMVRDQHLGAMRANWDLFWQ